MSKKIYDFAIDSPLTKAKRKAVDQYIVQNAELSPSGASHAWDREAENVLHIDTPPLKWEVRFGEKNVEVFGELPIWARILFTKEKKAFLEEQIELLLRETGFTKAEGKAAKA